MSLKLIRLNRPINTLSWKIYKNSGEIAKYIRIHQDSYKIHQDFAKSSRNTYISAHLLYLHFGYSGQFFLYLQKGDPVLLEFNIFEFTVERG